jgi:hypothetical protein
MLSSPIDGEEILAATIISEAYPKDQKCRKKWKNLLVKLLAYVRSFMRN